MLKKRHTPLLEDALGILGQRMCRQDGISRFFEINSIVNYKAAPGYGLSANMALNSEVKLPENTDYACSCP